MANNPEPAFAEEAQEETIIHESSTVRSRKSNVHVEENDVSVGDENEPLLSQRGAGKRQPYSRANKSYQRAINEPWTGHYGKDNRPWYKTPSVFWLLPALFPYCMAFGGVLVPRTYLILNLLCKNYLSDRAAHDPNFRFPAVHFGQGENPQCRDYHVQQKNAWFNIYSGFLAGFFSAIVTPHVGALSDRIGRKKVIILASMGGLANEILTIIVGTNPETVSVYWLLLGSLADGLSGSFTAAMALAFSYATDCTAPDRRGVAFGYFQATLFTGVGLGPLLAAWLIKITGNVMIVFYIALGCHMYFLAFTTFLVPESLSHERQEIAQEKYAKEMAERQDESWLMTIPNFFIKPLQVLRPVGPGSSPLLKRNLLALAAIDTMMFGVAMGAMQIILIYAEYRYGWDAVDSSLYLSVVNICRVSGLVLLLPLLSWLFRQPTQTDANGHQGADRLDIGIIRGSILFDLVGYLGYALAPTGAVFVCSGLIASIGGIGSPTLQSAITKHVTSDKTGLVLGAMGLLHALSRFLAPALFNLIYGLTVQYYAGIVFLCLASVFIMVFILSLFLKPHVFFHDSTTSTTERGDDSVEAEQSGS